MSYQESNSIHIIICCYIKLRCCFKLYHKLYTNYRTSKLSTVAYNCNLNFNGNLVTSFIPTIT